MYRRSYHGLCQLHLASSVFGRQVLAQRFQPIILPLVQTLLHTLHESLHLDLCVVQMTEMRLLQYRPRLHPLQYIWIFQYVCIIDQCLPNHPSMVCYQSFRRLDSNSSSLNLGFDRV